MPRRRCALHGGAHVRFAEARLASPPCRRGAPPPWPRRPAGAVRSRARRAPAAWQSWLQPTSDRRLRTSAPPPASNRDRATPPAKPSSPSLAPAAATAGDTRSSSTSRTSMPSVSLRFSSVGSGPVHIASAGSGVGAYSTLPSGATAEPRPRGGGRSSTGSGSRPGTGSDCLESSRVARSRLRRRRGRSSRAPSRWLGALKASRGLFVGHMENSPERSGSQDHSYY